MCGGEGEKEVCEVSCGRAGPSPHPVPSLAACRGLSLSPCRVPLTGPDGSGLVASEPRPEAECAVSAH